MISAFVAAAALAGGFQHPSPSPPADLAASDYRERRERLTKALDGCIAVIGAQGEMSGITAFPRKLEEVEAWVAKARR